MKKLIAIALVLMLCLAIMPMAFADDLIPVGIINLDPAESGYRELHRSQRLRRHLRHRPHRRQAARSRQGLHHRRGGVHSRFRR